jgi:hypothetical protein
MTLSVDVRRDTKAFLVPASSREAVLRYLEAIARTPDLMVTFKDAWREFSGAK